MRHLQTWMLLGLLWGCGGPPDTAAPPEETGSPEEGRQVRAFEELTTWIDSCFYISFNNVYCTGGVGGGVTPYTYHWLLNHTSWTQGSTSQSFYCPKECTISFAVRDAALTWSEPPQVSCERLNHTCTFDSL